MLSAFSGDSHDLESPGRDTIAKDLEPMQPSPPISFEEIASKLVRRLSLVQNSIPMPNFDIKLTSENTVD